MKKNKKKLIGAIALLGAAIGFSVGSPSVFAKAEESSGVRTVASYFQAGEGVEFVTDSDTPSYVKEQRNGVLVDSENGGVFTYENLIETEDLTKDRLLFEMQVTPKTAGEAELEQFIVRIEDSEDERVYVNISLHNYLYGNGSLHGVLAQMTVKTNTVETYRSLKYTNKFQSSTQEDKVSRTIKTGIKQGTELYAPMAGNKGGHSESFKIYYDNEDNAIYTVNDNIYVNKTDADPKGERNVLKECGFADEEGRFLVIDLDDHKHMGELKNNLFTGFPSGKAKLSIQTNGVLGESARYTLLTIDGQTFNGEYLNDTTPPDLTVDLQGYETGALPVAFVGQEYPLFGAVAEDKMYGTLGVAKKVIDGTDVLYCTKDGFIPRKTGEYELCFEATDGNGNKAEKRYTVTAVERTEMTGTLVVEKGAYDFTDENLKNPNGNFVVALYYPVKLPKMTVEGGSGKVSVQTEVTLNGRLVETEDGILIPDRKGVYEVKYVLHDYLGNIRVYEYAMETFYSDAPTLSQPNLPSHVLIGQETALPAVSAELYTAWMQPLEAYKKITVYKADGETVVATFNGNEEAIYLPKTEDGEKVIIEYLAAKDENSEPVVYQREVFLINGNTLADRFVKDEGVSVEQYVASINFNFTQDGQTVRFLNPLSIYDGLPVKFQIPEDKNAFNEVVLTFTDRENADIWLSVSVYKTPKELVDPNDLPTSSLICVNGKNVGEINSTFYGNVIDPFLFTLSKDGKIYDFNDNVVSFAENFPGFTSNFVYFSFTVKGIEGESAVKLAEISNQVVGDTDQDYMNPVLNVLEKPVGTAHLGDQIRVGGAIASDVFNIKTSLKVAVTFAGKELTSFFDEYGRFDGAAFVATDYGTYTISYEAKDLFGNTAARQYSVEIVDDVPPTVTVNGEMPKEIEVGKALVLPKAVATDNKDVDLTVYIVIIDPMNVFTVIEQGEKYIVPHKGRYIVKYYVEDRTSNTVYSENYVLNAE